MRFIVQVCQVTKASFFCIPLSVAAIASHMAERHLIFQFGADAAFAENRLAEGAGWSIMSVECFLRLFRIADSVRIGMKTKE